MAEALKNVADVRAHFKREGVTVAAFAAPDGRHVLIELDRRVNLVYLVDPTFMRSGVLAWRIRDCWPLRVLRVTDPLSGRWDAS